MGETPEGKVKKRVKEMLRNFGDDVYWCMPATGGYGGSGTPDILVCAFGKFLAIECKAGNNTTTALQDSHLAHIRDAHGTGLIINEHNMDVLAVTLAAWKGEYERDASKPWA